MGASAISPPDTKRRARFQQRRWLPDQIQHFEKTCCQNDIGLRSPEKPDDVPVE